MIGRLARATAEQLRQSLHQNVVGFEEIVAHLIKGRAGPRKIAADHVGSAAFSGVVALNEEIWAGNVGGLRNVQSE